jgi:hypothetical protein
MRRINLIIPVVALAILVIAYLLYERRELTREINRLRQNEAGLRREAELENTAWKKLYTDCVTQNKTLVAKLKDVSAERTD